MDTPIPDDQLTRLRPLVDQLLRDLLALNLKLPDDAESAVDYSLREADE